MKIKSIREGFVSARRALAEDVDTSEFLHYLITDKKGNYFLFSYDYDNGGNQQHMGNAIDDRAHEKGFTNHVVAAYWRGDIAPALAKAQAEVSQYESRKKKFPARYNDAVKKVESLSMAKEMMDDGSLDIELEEAGVEEASNPIFAINKFLSDKEELEAKRARRGERLRKERDERLAWDRGEPAAPRELGESKRRRK